MPAKIELPEDEIVNMYKSDVPIQDIALKFGVSENPIVTILKNRQCRKPNKFKSLPYALYQQVINREWFTEIVNACISKTNVAKHTGLNYDMVASLYKYHQIEETTSAEARSLLLRKDRGILDPSHEAFIELYHVQHRSLTYTASVFGVSVGYLRTTLMVKWGEKARTIGESKLSREFTAIRDDKQQLESLISSHSLTELCQTLNVGIDTLSATIKRHQLALPYKSQSSHERLIAKWIHEINANLQFDENVRSIISPYEIDIWIPSKQLAIEVCGLYWHSSLFKSPNYHHMKLERCTALGIRLITIFEDEINDSPTIVRRKLEEIIGESTKVNVNARSCMVVDVAHADKRMFLNNNHIQGNDVSAKCKGLMHNGVLVALMTFSKPSAVRTSKNMRTDTIWELNRYATNADYRVRGGAGKLLAAFIRETPTCLEIYSYSDRRWSNGKMYDAIGFVRTSTSKPNYWYVPKGYHKREYRYNYAKYKLVEQGFDPTKTERQIMDERGYTTIYDCGMTKHTLTISVARTPH